MGKETKDRILDEALVSFVENGYKGTNLRDFAAGMELSKSALYSHYESKEAIWSALVDKLEAYYTAHFGSPEHLPETPKTVEEFYSLAMNMVNFTIHDKKIILTRNLDATSERTPFARTLGVGIRNTVSFTYRLKAVPLPSPICLINGKT